MKSNMLSFFQRRKICFIWKPVFNRICQSPYHEGFASTKPNNGRTKKHTLEHEIDEKDNNGQEETRPDERMPLVSPVQDTIDAQVAERPKAGEDHQD